jgi:hypothetical protein
MGTINLAETSHNVLVFNNSFIDNVVDKRGGALAIYATIAGARVSILSNKFSTNKFVIIVVLLLLLLLLFDCFFFFFLTTVLSRSAGIGGALYISIIVGRVVRLSLFFICCFSLINNGFVLSTVCWTTRLIQTLAIPEALLPSSVASM